MKSKKIILTTIATLLCLMPLVAKERKTITVSNKTTGEQIDVAVELDLKKLKLDLAEYIVVDQNGDKISVVELSKNILGETKAIFNIPVLRANEIKSLTIITGDHAGFKKRTHAELTHKIGGEFKGREYVGGYSWVETNGLVLPGTFEDHSYYIKYEGPGWENDRIAFRYYLDNRNAIDVFGKKTTEMALSGVGMDGFKNYHNMSFWGMDNMKVANSLGIGSIASWDGEKAVRVAKKDQTSCLITADGVVRSQIKTIYHGWEPVDGEKCDLTSLITIDAGARSSRMDLHTTKPVTIATGVIKIKDVELMRGASGDWSYVATFGKQSLNNDMQGLAVFVRTAQLKLETEDALNHLVVLEPDSDGCVEYHIMPTWELDVEPVVTLEQFQNAIDQVLERLNGVVDLKY